MHEGRKDFEETNELEHAAVEPVSSVAFNGPSGYGETEYSIDEEVIDQEVLDLASPHGRTEYELTIGANEFPLAGRLREARTPEEYAKLTADLEEFYVAHVEVLEGNKPVTCADIEAVEFAQMVQNHAKETEGEGRQPTEEILTSEDATEYLRRPGIMEGLSVKARKLLAVAFSATALAAAMPANAQGWGGRSEQVIQYSVQRGVREAQMAVQARMQMEQARSRCDLAIQSLENNAQLQIGNLQMRYGLNLSGIALLGDAALQRFQENNPHPTPQQIAAFNQARQIAMNTNMRIEQNINQCNVRMQQISQRAAAARTMRILGTIPVLLR